MKLIKVDVNEDGTMKMRFKGILGDGILAEIEYPRVSIDKDFKLRINPVDSELWNLIIEDEKSE